MTSDLIDQWKRSGILNERDEFVEWVHIWQMLPNVGNYHTLSMGTWESIPWIRPYGLSEPDAEMTIAAFELNRLDDWPLQWAPLAIWLGTPGLRNPRQTWYWRVFRGKGQHLCAAYLAGLKRDLTCQLRLMPMNEQHHNTLNDMVRAALAPYEVFRPQPQQRRLIA